MSSLQWKPNWEETKHHLVERRREHYDCDTGKALGVTFLGMSATVFTMALDGLTEKFAV